MIEQVTRPIDTVIESLTQHEIDSQFDAIVFELIGVNSALDNNDLQADVIQALREKQSELLSDLLKHPLDAVHHEFELLKRLYEGRTRVSTGQLGVVTSEFVTRDPDRQKADLHFREVTYESGASARIVEVPSREPAGLPFFAIARADELVLEQIVYKRGEFRHIQLDPASVPGQRLMVEFLTHSIAASDLMYNRSPDQIDDADQQALRFLRTKKIADITF